MWNKLSRRDQATARTARDKMHQLGWEITVSKIAKHLDIAEAFLAGRATAEELGEAADGIAPPPATVELTAAEAAAKLGVSVRTIQRRAQRGQLDARKDERGRWIITTTN